MDSTEKKIKFGITFVTPDVPLSFQRENWKQLVSKVESLGFSGIFIPDHFYPQWDPISTSAAIAAITENIDVGTIVCCVDYRHPVVHAKASATINLISNNRHIFGIGAGWMKEDYEMAGIPFDKAAIRIRRLDEALQIIKGMWTQESTSIRGRHYSVRNLPKAVHELEFARPRLMVGGGGKLMLKLVGRHADIASVNYRIYQGENKHRKHVLDGSLENLGKKVDIVKRAAVSAGRDPDDIVFSQYFASSRMYGNPDMHKKQFAERFGTTIDAINNCTWILVDEPDVVVEKLKMRYEDYGFSYFMLDGGDFPTIEDLERFSDKVIKPLSRF